MPGQHSTAWRFLNTAFGNAFFNMATDEQLVRSVAAGASPPTLRVFGWEPPAVSFGYAQKIGKEVDMGEASRRGVDIVRRPTGGRAVLHWNELTYSVVCLTDHPILGGNISAVYRAISECLVAGLRTLGVDAHLEPGHAPVPSPRGKDITSPCFSSTSQYEITLCGKKLVGSSQRRIGETVLQHGSLLIGPEHKQIVDLMPAGHKQLRRMYADQLDEHTISLQEAGYVDLGYEQLVDGIRQGFEDTLGADLAEISLSDDERSGIEDLVANKYATPDWNHRDRSAQITRSLIV